MKTPSRILPRFTNVRVFETQGEAYDASQTDEKIRDGDVLVARSPEFSIAVLYRAWPVLVYGVAEQFHTTAAFAIEGAPVDDWTDLLSADPRRASEMPDYVRTIATIREVVGRYSRGRSAILDVEPEEFVYALSFELNVPLRIEGDLLAQRLVESGTLDDLIDCYARHGYRPTLRADGGPEYVRLADLYDARAEFRGLAVRAFRG